MSVLRRSLVLVLSLAACTSESPTGVAVPSSSASSKGGGGGTAAGGGTGGTTAGGGSTSTDPHFLVADSGAPAISNPVISFWAVKGIDRTVSMYYASRPGHHDSVTFYSLRIRAQSLFKRPDGSSIATGDSVFITATLVDAQHLIVDNQPSGLLFDPRHPATVKFSYANANPDLDHSGTITPVDSLLLHALMVWRRESPSSPWFAVPSHEIPQADEVEADIGGFTGYALAW